MDHGTLTDNNGRKADFRNVMLIMTTNAGAVQMNRASIGFARQDHSGDAMEVIKRLFTPEFRNRLDAVVSFSALDAEVIAHVVDKFIIELEGQLEDKRVTLDVDEPARAWLAERGFDQLMGARPMARVIQEHIKRPPRGGAALRPPGRGRTRQGGGRKRRTALRVRDRGLGEPRRRIGLRRRPRPRRGAPVAVALPFRDIGGRHGQVHEVPAPPSPRPGPRGGHRRERAGRPA